ncbi:MAG: hypothetical protein H7210_13430 [Pyrinomonadaceae bacterium]|nr:hypothetical protein [Phycisphaerales bacterium]
MSASTIDKYNPVQRRKDAQELLASRGWKNIILPHIIAAIASRETALLDGDLKKKERAAAKAVRQALKELRDLPGKIAPAGEEQQEEAG